MQDILVVVDMQNDFIDGALGTREAQAIVERVAEKIKGFSGKVLFTQDTHTENYMETQEGKYLPVPHCIRGTKGWEICDALRPLQRQQPLEKPTFGSAALGAFLQEADKKDPIGSVTLVGLCTDICVISNAMLLKAFLPETRILVDAACCAGVTPKSHKRALEAMKACQIQIQNEEE